MASHFTLSLELIYLLEWLLEHDHNRIRHMVKRAVQTGLVNKIATAGEGDPESVENEELQESFVEFMQFLEETLGECMHDVEHGQQLQQDLANVYQELNVDNVDGHTAMACIQDAQHELAQQNSSSQQELKQAILNKLLKNWKPHKNDLIN